MKLYLTLWIIMIVTSVSGQTGHMEVGVATGLNITSSHNAAFEQYFDWRYTSVTSIQTSYALSENISVITGLTYESKGCKGRNMKLVGVEKTSLGSNHTFDYALEYVTIPVLMRYSSSRIPFFINAGTYIGQLISYTETYDILTLDRSTDIKKEDYGICIGAGGTFTLSDNWNLSVEVRNNLGLVNVKNSDEGYKNASARPVTDLNPMYNNAINIFVGFNYKL